MEFEDAGKGKEDRSIAETDEANARLEDEVIEDSELIEVQIVTKKAEENHKLGIGIVAKQKGGGIRAEWALTDRSSSVDIQDEAIAVRLALMKASQPRWQKIKVMTANKDLTALLNSGAGDNPNMVTLVEDIIALAKLFQLWSFALRNIRYMNQCNQFNIHALSICMDEERTFVAP